MQDTPTRRILLFHTIKDRIPVDRTTLWRWERDGTFPKRVKLGSRSGWFEDEIDAWIAQRANER